MCQNLYELLYRYNLTYCKTISESKYYDISKVHTFKMLILLTDLKFFSISIATEWLLSQLSILKLAISFPI